MMTLRHMRIAFFCLLCICTTGKAIEGPRVAVVLSDDTLLYQNFATSLTQNLEARLQMDVSHRAEDFSSTTPAPDLIVTVGLKAANWVAPRTQVPMLATLIPQSQYAELSRQRPRGSATSAIFLNQPIERQIDLLQAALPERKKVGLLHSPEINVDIDEVRSILARHGMTLISKNSYSSDALHKDLEFVLDKSNVLLVIPDNAIYNSNTLRNILLQSYRKDVPLVGYSQGLVKSGALCAAFSSPEQIATQASAMVSQFFKYGTLPIPQQPQFFSIAVNSDVAKSMGISISDAESLKNKVDKLQGGRR